MTRLEQADPAALNDAYDQLAGAVGKIQELGGTFLDIRLLTHFASRSWALRQSGSMVIASFSVPESVEHMEHRRENELELEISIPSNATNRAEGLICRLVLRSEFDEFGLISITDQVVDGDAVDAPPVGDAKRDICLTVEEAEWLCARLPEMIAHAKAGVSAAQKSHRG